MKKFIALIIYFPLAKLSKCFEYFSMNVDNIPLSYYRNASFYTMQTDSLDKFGTKLEKRYSKEEIKNMMIKSGLINISFACNRPYWTAVGIKN